MRPVSSEMDRPPILAQETGHATCSRSRTATVRPFQGVRELALLASARQCPHFLGKEAPCVAFARFIGQASRYQRSRPVAEARHPPDRRLLFRLRRQPSRCRYQMAASLPARRPRIAPRAIATRPRAPAGRSATLPTIAGTANIARPPRKCAPATVRPRIPAPRRIRRAMWRGAARQIRRSMSPSRRSMQHPGRSS
jgi:hypothetical protein